MLETIFVDAGGQPLTVQSGASGHNVPVSLSIHHHHKLRLWQTQGPWPWSFLTLHGLSVHWSKHDLPQLEKIYFHQIISVGCNNDTPLPPPTHPEPIKRSQWPCSWLIWPYYAGSGHPAMFYSHHLCWNFSHYFQNSLGLTTPLWFLGWVSLRLTAGRRN